VPPPDKPLPPLVIWGGPYDPPQIWPQPPQPPQPNPPPSNDWQWHYDEELGWVLVPPGSGGKPQPPG